MKHSVSGRKFSRTKDERKRLFAGLVRDMLLRDRIITSLAKAKAAAPIVEKLITKAKAGGDVNRRQVEAFLANRSLTTRLFEETKTRFGSRTSGYTRITKLGKRLGDSTDIALLSFVDERVKTEVIAPTVAKKEKVTKEKAAKKTAKKA
jgi:large subunit ribosomal protein L17